VLLALLPSEARAGSLAYLGRSMFDPVSLSVVATVPLPVQTVHPSGARAYGFMPSGASAGSGPAAGRLGVLDTLSNAVVATVPLGFIPAGLALHPAGSRLYVTGTALQPGFLSDGTLLVIDTSTNLEVARLDLGPALRLSAPVVHPAGTFVYVFRDDDIAVIDTATNTLGAPIPLPDATFSFGLANPILHPSGHFMYVSTDPIGSSRVLVIDTRINAVVRAVPIPNSSFLGAIAPRGPDDARLFVFGSNLIGAVLTTSTAVFDAATGEQVGAIPLGARPSSATTDVPGTTVYAALFTCGSPSCNLRHSAGVAVIDADALAVTATLPTGIGEFERSVLSLDPGAGRLYVRSQSILSVIDTATRTIAASLPFVVESQSLAFVFGPDHGAAPGPLVFYRLASAGGTVAEQWGAPGDRPVPADYDGDGRADVAVWRPRRGPIEGLWFVHRSSDGAVVAQQWGAAATGDQPVPADYDGDGRADIAVWRRAEAPAFLGPAEGIWYIVRSSDGQGVAQPWGAAADRPVPADYDGDRRADIAVWRDGTWYIVSSRDGSVRTEVFGEPTDVPVPGDHDGDGRADLAVWRPATGEWWILGSRDGAVTRHQWGAPGDVPVPADYDGDGRTDLAVWRPGTGEWWILGSRDRAVTRHQWGAPGDVPVPADYDGDGLPDLTVYRP